jgi:hypothetical protein
LYFQESSTIYGDLLVSVSDQLTALFKKAHGLQMVTIPKKCLAVTVDFKVFYTVASRANAPGFVVVLLNFDSCP